LPVEPLSFRESAEDELKVLLLTWAATLKGRYGDVGPMRPSAQPLEPLPDDILIATMLE
jgi:hypothetical protein